MSHPPTARRAWIAVAAVVAAIASAAPAHAEPDVADLEADIAEAAAELETTVENHHAVAADLRELDARVDALAIRLDPVAEAGDRAAEELGDVAAALYRQGPSAAMVGVSAIGPADLANRLTMIQFIGRQHRDRIDAASVARDTLDEARLELDDLVEQRDALAEERSELEDFIAEAEAELEAVRVRASGFGYTAPAGLPAPAIPAGLEGAAAAAVTFAHGALGAPYVWGGSGPGFDCSGLTQAAWASAGVGLPHSSSGQYDVTAHIGRDELQPGDLVFYYSDLHHVALYVGEGSVIHAPTEGQAVQVAPVDLAPVAGYGRVR